MTTHYDLDTILDYINGELDPRADAKVFAHLERCTACRAMHDEEVAFGDALRAGARASELELPPVVRARVWDAVRHQPPTLLERLRSRWGPAIAVPIAAAVALGAYFGAPIFRGPSPAPGIAASFFLDEHNAEATQNPLGPGVTPAVFSAGGTASSSTAASYIDTADAATLDDASGAIR